MSLSVLMLMVCKHHLWQQTERKEGRKGFVPKSRTRTEHQTSNVSIAVDYGKLIVLLVFCYCDQDYLVVLSLCVPHVSAIREYRNNRGSQCFADADADPFLFSNFAKIEKGRSKFR